jgi:NADH dehydrogenase [ubiquinone] 1 alpha subcomplex assembly factor 1
MIHSIILLILIQSAVQDKLTIFDFAQENSAKGWYTVNDGVMGGLSKGQFSIENDLAVFRGEVSTDNNGGFTMIQNQFKTVVTKNFKGFVIKLKGDGKEYQFRVKSDRYQRYSYVFQFSTSGEWEEIIIPFSDLVPRFRGRLVDVPNFDGSQIQEVAFLIGNKRDESFKLQIVSLRAE